MRLSIHERIALLGVLPQEGNFVTMGLVQGLQNRLSLTGQEIDAVGFDIERIAWSRSKEAEQAPFEVELSQVEIDLVVEGLKKMDREAKLTVDFLPLYRRFVLGVLDAA